jgi:hypothetical protein
MKAMAEYLMRLMTSKRTDFRRMAIGRLRYRDSSRPPLNFGGMAERFKANDLKDHGTPNLPHTSVDR